MQLGLNFADGSIDQLVAFGGGHLRGNRLAGHADGNLHSLVAHVAHCACFGRCDLIFGRSQTACDRFFQLGFGLIGGQLGLFLGMGDDALGLFLHLFCLRS